MDQLESLIPASYFLIFLPQLASRICHKNTDTWDILEKIIVKVMAGYPQQANWIMCSHWNSSSTFRSNRAKALFEKAKKNDAIKSNQTEVLFLSANLIRVANYTEKGASKCTTYQLPNICPELSERKHFNSIIPLQNSLTPQLPLSGLANPSFQVFNNSLPIISSFGHNVETMNSLIAPKKITIKDDKGMQHIFLAKPKDDLRKDSRTMEFNAMVNKLLKKDPATRKRNLAIKTYSVVPLNEECGIIEWVPNTSSFRSILSSLYPKIDNNLIKEQYSANVNPIDRYNYLSDQYPPVFYKWFLNRFPEPSTWIDARNLYCKSIAVMSMVGACIGLGDRHAENILFDSSSGSCLHVDFNCLFWKGLTFNAPEKVPFRLTRNMVDAMGVSGTNGIYRSVCEETLRLLRNNRDTLIRVLETFIYDPYIDWIQNQSKSNSKQQGEVENDKGIYSLKKINNTLQGIPDVGLQLSIEGQVNSLIKEATDPLFLANMYIGWSFYF